MEWEQEKQFMQETSLHPNLTEDLSNVAGLIDSYVIPCKPDILDKLVVEYHKPTPCLESISKLISQDVSLSAGILQIAKALNTKYSFSTNFLSVEEAVKILGSERTLKVVKTLSVRDLKKFREVPMFDRFWDSSIDTAVLAAYLADKLFFNCADEAYILGLFRDCGIPILIQALPDYKQVLNKFNKDKSKSLFEIENEKYGFNHQLVGFALAQKWQLPWVVCWSILTHHDVELKTNEVEYIHRKRNVLVDLVTISEIIINEYRNSVHNREDILNQPYIWSNISPMIHDTLGVSQGDLEELMTDTLHHIEEIFYNRLEI